MKKYQNHSSQSQETRTLSQKSTTEDQHFGELPGQICLPTSRHLRNDFKMNVSTRFKTYSSVPA